MNNPTFQKSVRLLAHPLSLAALGLMLANDLVFKALCPSWWTGKLSDFAGLFFLPFLLAALAALCLPGRSSGAAQIGFGLTAAGFALLKLDAGFNAALLGAVHSLTGLSLQARPDPSDLLALLSLLPAAWLWHSSLVPRPAAAQFRWQWLLLPLAALVTLADAAAPDLGIACLQVENGRVLAESRYFTHIYQSIDGGLTWSEQANPVSFCGQGQTLSDVLRNPQDGSVYRLTPGTGVERSTDGGATWQLDYALLPQSEPEQVYFKMNRSSNSQFASLPYAALVDPASGNVLLAMGLDGILVRSPAGAWSWVAVGPYQHDSLRQAGAGGVLFLLIYQIALALLAGLGWLFTRSAYLMSGRAPRVWTVLGWIGLGLVSLLVSPDVITASYLVVGTFIGLGFMAVATLIALLVALIRLKGRFFHMLLSGIPQALLLAAVCLLPYVLWAVQVIPGYSLALAISAGLVILCLVIFSMGKEKHLTTN